MVLWALYYDAEASLVRNIRDRLVQIGGEDLGKDMCTMRSGDTTYVCTSSTVLGMGHDQASQLTDQYKGIQYRVGDFVVRAGIISRTTAKQGVVVEVEYLVAKDGDHDGVIREFIATCLPMSDRKAVRPHKATDTVGSRVEYLSQMAFLRRS